MTDLQTIRERITEELQPAKGERGKYYCPVCGSGSGPKKTGAFSIMPDKVHGKCFSCGFYGDRFDLVAARDHISLAEATRILIEQQPGGEIRTEKASPSYRVEDPQPVARSYSDYVAKAREALPGSAGEKYLLGRGFSPETISRFRFGFDPDHTFPQQGIFPAVVLPYDPTGRYCAWRAITEKHYDKPKAAEAGPEPIFNVAALYSGAPCFVVESQLDAVTLEQSGARAVAIGGTAGKNKLMRQLDKKAPSGPIVLCLDRDDPGRKAAAEISAALEEKKLFCIDASEEIMGEGCKDPNELLQADPERLQENIRKIITQVEEITSRATEEQQQEAAEQLEARARESAAGYIDNFLETLKASKAAPAISTGFDGLDRLLDGGFYPGLYIMGAITSLGKSTFTLQVADNIAASGHDVLCFNLEMARAELMAKSISRLTFQIARREGQPLRRARTTRDILASRKWQLFDREEMALMAAAIDEYKATTSAHIWHYEGVGDIGVEQIRAEVERHITITGRLPVVVVDYLQILASPDLKMSDKQAVDKNVLELKRLSRDKGIPVFAISSLNRDNYLNPINSAAFKESGAVEYSSDCLMGLQFEGMDYQDKETESARTKRIRDLIRQQKAEGNSGRAERIELKILKNRNGRAGTAEVMLYTPCFNHYEEDKGFTEVDIPIPAEWAEDEAASSKKRKPI